MAEIINFFNPTLRYDYALSLIKKGLIKEAVYVLEDIKDKDLKVLLALLDCYDLLKVSYYKCITLQNIIKIKPEKIYYQTIIQELKKMKKNSKAFSYAFEAKDLYPYDPDFKKEILEILIQNEKYQYALKFLKQNKNSLCYEKYLFYLGYLYRENGKRFKSLWIFRKMVKKYPFSVLYRYLLASAYQSLRLHKKSEDQMSFIRDFLKQIPSIASARKNESDFAYLMQNMMEAMK